MVDHDLCNMFLTETNRLNKLRKKKQKNIYV